jgi:hypothetical protein
MRILPFEGCGSLVVPCGLEGFVMRAVTHKEHAWLRYRLQTLRPNWTNGTAHFRKPNLDCGVPMPILPRQPLHIRFANRTDRVVRILLVLC